MFRTELPITPQERQFARTARVLTLGSCFADSIGERLRQNKVNALTNPFGTVFQPLALAKLLRAAAGEDQDWQQHVVEARGRWQSYDFHGTLGADTPVELLQLIQQKVQQVQDFLRQTDLVILTLGTAWAYRLRETGELVSNLHKLPAALFEKELLTADEIVNGLAEVHALLRQLRPSIRIVLTVSPVRHIKDTLPLNAVSKSVLRVACHYLSELLPNVSYFPAFELLNDELRDYRFYAADMLHPSEVAEDFIWDKFARAYFDADFGRFRKEWAAVRQSLQHRPLHLGAPEHRHFLDQTAERLERLASQGVEVRHELREVRRQLAALPPPRPAYVPEPADDGEERIDIGGDDTPRAELVVAPAEHPDRNRRGRGRQHGRSQQPEPAAPPTEATEIPLVEVPNAPAEATLPVAETDAALAVEATGYPAKKKKRRSRGGAKRTARKHAARLAAEQTLGALAEAETHASEPSSTEALPSPGQTADATYLAEAADNEAHTAPSLPPTPEVWSVPGAATPAPTEQGPTPDEDLTEQPVIAPRARRGAGPTPKKSKVITKSAQVRRPKRTTLFSNQPAPPAATEPVIAAPTPAPISSTPISPESQAAQPVVAEAVENPAAQAEATPAISAAKPRRGRPKATSSATTEAPTLPAPVPAEPEAITTKPRTAASGARRGRPPGRKTPPETDKADT